MSSSPLHGHWRLVGWTGTNESGVEIRHGGAEPRGDLIYLPSGRMAVQIQHDGRTRFGSRELDAGEPDLQAAAYRTYVAYAGTYSLPREGVVVHHLDTALHPDQLGMDKERRYALEDGDPALLTLETQRLRTEDGGEASSLLRWRRDERF